MTPPPQRSRCSAASLANGVTIEVKGNLVAGVVNATSVEIKSSPAPEAVEFEATGNVSAFVSVSSFTVGGQKIDASAATFERGAAANLANGVRVQVKGTLSAGIVKATRVRFEN